MRTKNHQPTAEQDRWHNDLRGIGSVISGAKPVEIHHCAGAAAENNGIHIGQWFVIPLTEFEHHSLLPTWGGKRKRKEKELFLKTLDLYVLVYERLLPFDADVEEAILNYTKGA